MKATKNEKSLNRMLWSFGLCSFLIGLDSLVVSPIIPVIAKELDFELRFGGLLVTSYALLYGFSAPLFGPVSDRWGRKNMILLGIVVFAIGTALTSLSTNLFTALLYRGIAGLGGAMLMPSIYALIGDTFSYEKRGKAMGLVMGALIGSQVIGVPVGAFLSYYMSWKITFNLIAGISFIAYVVIVFFVPVSPSKQTIPISPISVYISQFKLAFTNLSVFYALLSTFLWMAGLQGMFAFVGVFYKENFGIDVNLIGLIAMLAAASSVLGSVIGGRVSDRLGKKVVISVAAIFSSIGVLVFSTLTENIYIAVISQVIWAFFVGCGQSTLTALLSELNSQVRGTVLSLNSSAMYIGTMSATAISTYTLNLGYSFFAVGIMCSVASLLVYPITKYFIKIHEPVIVSKIKIM